MNFKVGDFCMFSPSSTHPFPKRKFGKIISYGKPFFEGKEGFVNVLIEDSYGKWEYKDQINITANNEWSLEGLSGVHRDTWKDEEYQKDVEYFQKYPEYFKCYLPSIFTTDAHNETVDDAKNILKPILQDDLHYEREFVHKLEKLRHIFVTITQYFPRTLKLNAVDSCSVESKDNMRSSIFKFYDDVIYKFEYSYDSRKNFKTNKTSKSVPRFKLSQYRIEELRMACILLVEEISNWNCKGNTETESIIDERKFIEHLIEADKIRKEIIGE